MGDTPAVPTPKEVLALRGASEVLRLYASSPSREKGVAAVRKALELGSNEAAQSEIDRALDVTRDELMENRGRVSVEEDARIVHYLRPALEEAIEGGDINAVRADAELGRDRRKIWGADQVGENEGAQVIVVPAWAERPAEVVDQAPDEAIGAGEASDSEGSAD